MLCHEVRVNVQSHVERGGDSYMFVRLRGVLQMEVLSVSYEQYYIVPCMQATPKSFADFSSTRFWIMFHSVVCLQPSSLWLRNVPFQVWNTIEAILHFFAACFYSTWCNSYSNNIESKKQSNKHPRLPNLNCRFEHLQLPGNENKRFQSTKKL